MMNSVQLFCVANNKHILARDFLRSPEINAGCVSLEIIWDAASASIAYNDAVNRASADILVFAHQDIYFPQGWFRKLKEVCDRLTSMDPSWAVAGLIGVTKDCRYVGHLWDSGLGAICGGPFEVPEEAASLDEVVLIVRRSMGVSFDPELPSFHLYGTDIVLRARELGKKAYVVDLPVIHNSRPIVHLDPSYMLAYRFMVRKWRLLLPWPTVIIPLTRNPLPRIFRGWRLRYKSVLRASTLHAPLERPEIKAKALGFGDVDDPINYMTCNGSAKAATATETVCDDGIARSMLT